MPLAWVVACCLAAAALVTWYAAPPVSAQAPGAKIWDGVYSVAQAKRGEAAYTSYCVRCHGADLMGGGRQGRQLKGDAFWQTWQSNSLQSLFAKMQGTMPRDDPSTLPDAVYVDVIAFILDANALPPGAAELKADRALLDAIRIEQRGSSGQVANFSLVDVVGCLTQRADGRWVLTNATTPVAADGEGPSAGAPAAVPPPGAESFRLLGVTRFDPGGHRGQTMRAKGLIDKTSGDSRLDLTSLQTVAPSCVN
jgi:mono/diheme cytochrome c family protein